MIKITLEYATVDEAIVALAKLAGGKLSKAADGGAPVTPNAEPPATKRKGRSDAGKPRGPYKESEAPATSLDASTNGGQKPVTTDLGNGAEKAPAQTSTTTAPVPAASDPAAQPTAADAQAAVAKLFEAKGMAMALEVLGKFGVRAIREMKPEDYAAFIKAAQEAI